MSNWNQVLKPQAAAISASVMLICLYVFSLPPRLSAQEASALASRFKFERLTLPEPAGHSFKFVRPVNRSLKRIAAWISATGAAVALGDIDGDGLPNDYVLVDPRTDLVIVGPVPGTGARYEKFTLAPQTHPYSPDTTAPMGCLITDLNEDGLMDVLVYYWGRTPVAFLRREKTDLPQAAAYTEAEIAPRPERWYTGAATVADLDGDGHLDLVFGNYFPDGSNVLDASAPAAVTLQDTNSRSFNGGRKHVFLGQPGRAGRTDNLFSEAGAIFDENVTRGWTLAQGICDLDGDLLPEIYFAHDLGPDRLLHNTSHPGKPAFELLSGRGSLTTPDSFVLGHDSFKGMGVDFGDLNFDGMPEIYVSNIASEGGLQESHFLWLSNLPGSIAGQPDSTVSNDSDTADGDKHSAGRANIFSYGIAPYSQAAGSLGLSRGGWGWDCRLVDMDNDGMPEALQAKGFIKGKVNRWPEAQSLGTTNSAMLRNPNNWPSFEPGDDVSGNDPDSFYVRAKDGKYYDIARELGLDDRRLSRGIALADVDGDGRIDFAVANQWGDSFFFHNLCPSQNQFLGLHLYLPVARRKECPLVLRKGSLPATGPARPAIGAEATITLPDGNKLRASADGGSGHSGKRSPDIHFGLGRLGKNETVKVDLRWLSGAGRQSLELHLKPGWYTVELPERGS